MAHSGARWRTTALGVAPLGAKGCSGRELLGGHACVQRGTQGIPAQKPAAPPSLTAWLQAFMHRSVRRGAQHSHVREGTPSGQMADLELGRLRVQVGGHLIRWRAHRLHLLHGGCVHGVGGTTVGHAPGYMPPKGHPTRAPVSLPPAHTKPGSPAAEAGSSAAAAVPAVVQPLHVLFCPPNLYPAFMNHNYPQPTAHYMPPSTKPDVLLLPMYVVCWPESSVIHASQTL